MLFARVISVEGCLFLIFILGLFVVLNVPLQNILRKVIKGNDRLVAIMEICFILIVARIMARWAAPTVTELIRRTADLIIDMLTYLFQH